MEGYEAQRGRLTHVDKVKWQHGHHRSHSDGFNLIVGKDPLGVTDPTLKLKIGEGNNAQRGGGGGGGGGGGEGLFIFNDTIEGPRAPADKPGRITRA